MISISGNKDDVKVLDPIPEIEPALDMDHFTQIALCRGYWEAIRQFESALLKNVYAGNISQAAKALRLKRTTLSTKLEKHCLKWEISEAPKVPSL